MPFIGRGGSSPPSDTTFPQVSGNAKFFHENVWQRSARTSNGLLTGALGAKEQPRDAARRLLLHGGDCCGLFPLQGQVTSAAGPHDALIERESAP